MRKWILLCELLACCRRGVGGYPQAPATEVLQPSPIHAVAPFTVPPGQRASYIVFHDDDVYYVNTDYPNLHSTIYREPRSGGPRLTIAEGSYGFTAYGPLGADDTALYYFRDISSPLIGASSSTQLIRQPFDGSAPSVVSSTGDALGMVVLSSPSASAYDNAGALTALGAVAGLSINQPMANGSSTDGRYLYFSLLGPPPTQLCAPPGPPVDQVARVPLAGGAIEIIADAQSWPGPVVVNAQGAYWIAYGVETCDSGVFGGQVMAVSDLNTTPTALADYGDPDSSEGLGELAVDDDNLYWASYKFGGFNSGPPTSSLVHYHFADASVTTLVTPTVVEHIALDDTTLYWLDDTGTLNRIQKDQNR